MKISEKKLKELVDFMGRFNELISGERDGRYFVTNVIEILETPFPIEGVSYDDKIFNFVFFMDMNINGRDFYKIWPEDYTELQNIPHNLKEGIKKVAGRRYSEPVVYHGREEFPYINARFLQKGSEILKTNYISYSITNKKAPVYLYAMDNACSPIKLLILPIINRRSDYIGFRNEVTYETYNIHNGKE